MEIERKNQGVSRGKTTAAEKGTTREQRAGPFLYDTEN